MARQSFADMQWIPGVEASTSGEFGSTPGTEGYWSGMGPGGFGAGQSVYDPGNWSTNMGGNQSAFNTLQGFDTSLGTGWDEGLPDYWNSKSSTFQGQNAPFAQDQAIREFLTNKGLASNPDVAKFLADRQTHTQGLFNTQESQRKDDSMLKTMAPLLGMMAIPALGIGLGAAGIGGLGGAEATAGGALAGAEGAGGAGWGVMQGLSPEALSAIGTGSAIDMGGTGLTAAEWGLGGAGAAGSGMAGLGPVGAGQMGAGGLGAGMFAPGGTGVAGAGATDAGMGLGAGGGGTGLPQTPTPSGTGGGTPGGGGGQWPTGQPTVGSGASQALGLPPPATPPSAGVPPTAPGGDFVSGILDQLKKNALSLGLMGVSLLGAGAKAGQTPQALQEMQNNTGGARALGQEYIDAARAGRLTGPQQAGLDKYTQDAKNQVRQYFASIGQFDSTSRIKAEQQIDQTALGLQAQMIQQTLTQGLQALGVGNGPLAQVATYQAGQDQALIQAMGSFAQGIGSLFGQQAGKGQTTTPTQQTEPTPQAATAEPGGYVNWA